MQNAKDTFYEVLRARLAAVNPERTTVMRGMVRPAVLVEENELISAEAPPADCFRLRWLASEADVQSAMTRCAMRCEVLYETAGTALNAGMDRGRVLSAMDRELIAMVHAQPQRAAKVDYSKLPLGKPSVRMTTNVWWSDVAFGAVVVKAERLSRTAVIELMSFEEAGEV